MHLTFKRRLVVVVFVTIVIFGCYNAPKVDMVGQQTDIPLSHPTIGDTWRTTSKSTPISVVSPAPGRRADDGVWFDFSDAPVLLFYAYTAFVDDRPLPPTARK